MSRGSSSTGRGRSRPLSRGGPLDPMGQLGPGRFAAAHRHTRSGFAGSRERRFCLISGVSHGVGNVTSRGQCQQFLSPTSPFPALCALLMALDQWVVNGTEPPQSQVPKQTDKTAAMAVPRPGHQTGVVPQEALGWPTIPGVTYTGVITSRYHLDFRADAR